MKMNKIAVLVIICALAMASAASLIASVKADTPIGNVYTTSVNDSTATTVLQFNAGQTVYIWFTFTQGGTQDIAIYSNAACTALVNDYGQKASPGGVTFVIPNNTPAGTNYWIRIQDVPNSYQISVTSITVLPEVAVFGSIAALGAGFAAFGLVKMKRIKI